MVTVRFVDTMGRWGGGYCELKKYKNESADCDVPQAGGEIFFWGSSFNLIDRLDAKHVIALE